MDDTLAADGKLLPETYSVIFRLAESGVRVSSVTGGCGGLCYQIIRTWPVTAVIDEGGAFYAERSAPKTIQWHYWADEATHRRDQADILASVKALDFELNLARGQGFRYVDVAVDYNQQQSLIHAQVKVIHESLISLGFNVRQSSIHLNIVRGDFDKASMSMKVGLKLFGLAYAFFKQLSVFIVDAPNDECMFEYPLMSIGVANIHKNLSTMARKPAVIMNERSGLGFVEMAET